MTKVELAERIKRRLGAPMIKVELDYTNLYDAIDYARDKWVKWAVGQSTHETFFTIALSATQYLYDLPVGVIEVVNYDTSGASSGINTLFTVDNYLYNEGMYDALLYSHGGDYTMISYHIARDFLDTVRKYTPDAYNYKYHRYSNQLEIQPPPVSGGTLTYTPKYQNADGIETLGDEITINSPGWILIRAYMLEGSTLDPDYEITDSNSNFYESGWILDYATAYSKKMLGMVRRKFASFGSLGNQGIALDGSELISEADAEMESLGEKLKLEEAYTGYGISIGF